jgi:hypothetical protein
VIEEVRDNFRNSGGTLTDSVTQMRIRAGHSVASRQNISNQAVLDKFIRQLQPDIKVASEFDTLLKEWLVDNSPRLRSIVLKHKSDSKDQLLIDRAFHKGPEEDRLLAEEFGVDPYDADFMEGKEKLRIHLIKERNRHLVEWAKEKWLEQNKGAVICSICSFSFADTYGDLGKGYIEVHHIVPISTLTPDTIVKVSDVAPVCSNCHSIIHRYRPWLSMDNLKKSIRERQPVL